MRKAINIVLISFIFLIQPWLWRAEGGILEVLKLRKQLAVQQEEIKKLQARNQQLNSQVANIKSNLEAVEEYARFKLGMIKKEESYFQVIMPVE